MEWQYHLPYTKMNCEVFASTEFISHCSHAPFYGIETGNKGAFTHPVHFFITYLGMLMSMEKKLSL